MGKNFGPYFFFLKKKVGLINFFFFGLILEALSFMGKNFGPYLKKKKGP
jgi:hypothetical protein